MQQSQTAKKMIEVSSLEIIRLPAWKLAAMIRSKEFTSYEVIFAFLDRIEVVNDKVNAVVAFRPEEAGREA